ncbi:MAG: methyltransferase domain-containing protein [Bdellovibrionaceae bacterium]|nr:methyltransferase domain-containing protein [Pseudobdellovibrionaceae bacterium]
MENELPQRFIQVDEEGFVLMSEIRTTDKNVGGEVLTHLEFAENGAFVSRCGGVPVIVEAFDEPFVANQVSVVEGQWQIELPYDIDFDFELSTLCLDEWDRFHGKTKLGIPFVFSRTAQASFFNLLEEFDDETISFDGESYEIPPYFSENEQVEKDKYWTDAYIQEGNPGWNLGEPAEALKDMLPRLKLPKSRVLVLGCGEGHDAAFFAQAGHVVTAVDFSEEAVTRARQNYGTISGLTFVKKDVFKLEPEFHSAFDIVFEHTCYCAINPAKRAQMVKVWRQCLHDQGQVMGVFFTMYKKQGPPYGGSEWELRQRLKDSFQFIFWGRWQMSTPRRQGKELFVLGLKKAPK